MAPPGSQNDHVVGASRRKWPLAALIDGVIRLGILYAACEPAGITAEGGPERARPAHQRLKQVRAGKNGDVVR